MSPARSSGRALHPSLREELESRLEALRRPLGAHAPSELTFSNLYLFRAVRCWRYRAEPLPHLDGRAYDGTRQLVLLADLATVPIQDLAQLQGEDGWFCPVAAATLASLDQARITWHENRDDADYLYDAVTFRDYTAPGLTAKRAAVERLRAAHRLDVQGLDADTRSAALEVLGGWCRDKGIGPDGADAPACREALTADCGLFGQLHRVDGVPAGFVLCEALNPGVTVVRFAKGLRAFDGIFPAMYQQLARDEELRIQWLNFEQDLGRANFRRSKLSFKPAMMLPKYRVRVRG